MSKIYNSNSIEVLSGLDPVKIRPGMYTDTRNPNHLACEVIDNSIDEILAGYGTTIKVKLLSDGGFCIEDNGRGIPVDIHDIENKSGVELILTKLHSGGKFNNDNYSFSGGLHGVGISVVNALSKRLEVEIKRNGIIYYIAFENGLKVEPLVEIGKVGLKNTGTKISFWIDEKYFDSPSFVVKNLTNLLKAKAVLCKNCSISFIDNIKDEEYYWEYTGGLSDYLLRYYKDDLLLLEKPLLINHKTDEFEIDTAFLFNNENITLFTESYVNLIPTSLGGTHVNGFKAGLFEAVNEFCDLHNCLPKSIKIIADDVFSIVSFVLSIKIKEPQFSGQTKERLSSRYAYTLVLSIVKDFLILWMAKNKTDSLEIISLILERANSRLKKAKKVTRKKSVSGPILPGKLVDCREQDINLTELFLVEGDSAGGTVKSARNKVFQAFLPLRGKILNSWEVSSDEALNSQEINDIAIAIGIDPDSNDLSTLRYGKICILADADSDGAHIATLICSLFLKHFTQLVKAGHVFVAMPPLYRVDIGKSTYYALDDEDLKHYLYKNKSKASPKISRFKGLGEMDACDIGPTTLNPATRRLIQLQINNDLESDMEIFDRLFSKKRSADRKILLEEKGNIL